MKTLFIAKFFPPVKGGSTRWYEEIYSRFEAGEVLTLTQQTDGWEIYDKQSRMNIFRMAPWGDAGLHPKWIPMYLSVFRMAAKLARSHGAKMIHCDTVLPAGLIGFFLSKSFGIPYVVYAHGEEIKLFNRLIPEKFVIPFIYQKAYGVIANSVFSRELLLQLGVDYRNIYLIHPGVDTKMYRPDLDTSYWRRKLGLKDKMVLLTVGRLTERKGHDQVIRALPELLSRYPDLIYIVAGTGAEEKRLKQLSADLNVSGSVYFTGFVPDELLPSLYNLADIFIMPNRETVKEDIEGFGIVFIEANACGKPVIAGRSGGAGSAVAHEHTGLLVDGRSVKEISEAVSRLVVNRDLAKNLGENGRKRAVTEFNLSQCLMKIRNIGRE